LIPVSDAMTVSGLVDAMIVVVRAGLVRRGSLVELRRLVDRAPATKLGFVLSGAKRSSAYGYRYDDTDGYRAAGQTEERRSVWRERAES
jgi:hypothetical protein